MGSLSRRVRERIGRRGFLLVLSGIAWTLTGYQITQESLNRFASGSPDPLIIFEIMNSPLWGWLWIIGGLSAIVIGLYRNCRWLDGRDDIGFNMIVTPAFIWTLFFATSWTTFILTGGDHGQGSASYGLVIWGTISAFILTIAGWPEVTNISPLGESETHEEHEDEKQQSHHARKLL